ncbi:nucleotidyltransferase domain-containing protein [Curtobacterium sp. MCSS17_016]|uniref:nucleotidyltransferase domain-containing protein n=1 Tax=Curtobacterium sp. MCSS17_016 TaxID=2175644 RepID=UPI0015E88339|nr:nucleotidyltransferase domain-containing protein [Curtobacterium sp. MCSS17_016]WIE81138.1 nucleotidyltransferase domain-containing protein [Curtobacterium sp. MCSS17_016]
MTTPFPAGFDWLPEGTALLGEYGSRAHGTDNPESDRDFHAIRVEPPRFVTGLERFDNLRHNTAGNGRSAADDLDTVVYGLRNWAAVAAAGNPNSYVLLHLPKYEYVSDVGQMLLDNRHLFVSKLAASKYIGYLDSQVQAMLGNRGARVQRPHLIERFGWDVKFGYHAVRVGLQGLELMRSGKITLPFEGEDLEALVGIREGRFTRDDVVKMANGLIVHIRAAAEHSRVVPDKPDYDKIHTLLHDMYQASWAA